MAYRKNETRFRVICLTVFAILLGYVEANIVIPTIWEMTGIFGPFVYFLISLAICALLMGFAVKVTIS